MIKMNRSLLAAELHMSEGRQLRLSYELYGTCVYMKSMGGLGNANHDVQLIPASYGLEYFRSVLVVKYCETQTMPLTTFERNADSDFQIRLAEFHLNRSI